jgi:two-component system, sensor histidine kinase RpfC
MRSDRLKKIEKKSGKTMLSRTTTRDVGAALRMQAKVRIVVGFPVLLLGVIAIGYGGVPYGPHGVLAVATIAILHAAYMSAAFFFAARIQQNSNARYLVIATAVLDPLMLSGWLTMMSEFGALFVCFYLFTILGFGFRIGRKAMWTCQVASLIGFAIIVMMVPTWNEHRIFGLSLFAVLLVVPLYATTLIKTLRDAQAHAEFESQAKSQLLAKVSHELRTPLSGIVASAQLISAEAPDAHMAKRADIILRLSNDLLLEINDLLDSAKFEAKALILEPVLFDLTSVAEQVRLTFGSAAAAKGINFIVTMDPRIENMVQCDAHQLSRALKNLVGNAVKFTDQGKVEVTLKLLKNDGDCYRIRFSVRDTGIGIPLEIQEKIFDPFFQASSGTTRQYGGTGLGMSLAKEVVTMMGSEIIVQSEPGTGSLFYFDINLPVVIKPPHESSKPIPILPIFDKRVLVADDNATNLMLIKELLERDRHIVSVTTNGDDALALLGSQNFDVIFLDYNMGDMDGGQVLQIYRFANPTATAVFFLTADTTATTTTELLNLGAAGVLYKPVTHENLRQAITQTCSSDYSPALITSPSMRARHSPAPLKYIPPQYLDLSVIENLQSFSQRPEFFTQVLNSATVDLEHNCTKLLDSLAAENIQNVHDTAHALSGLSESVGAVRLALLARKFMQIDRWELKMEKERWKSEIAEVTLQSVNCLRDILSNQNTVH